MESKKKITRVGGRESSANNNAENRPSFVPTAEAKGKARQLRVISVILWLLAIGAQIWAISFLFKKPVNMTWMIVLIVTDLILVIIGASLWKKSNRLDPASEKNKFLFMMQSQLGVIVSVIAFAPLIVLILGNKNVSGKQKGILAGIAALALVIAGVSSADFNPPSVEQYTEQTERVEYLNEGKNLVYWTKAGTVYHLYPECSYINTNRSTEIFEGTVAQARELKNITELCSRCENRKIKERGLNETPQAESEAAGESSETTE